jgi:HK97 gp10 family phage protein
VPPLSVGGQARNARGQFTVRLNNDRLVSLIRAMPNRTRASVDQSLNNIRDRARQQAPRDTGSLIASLYVSNGERSDYAQCAGTARGLNPQAVIEPEVRPEFVLSLFGQVGGFAGVVGSAVSHAPFNEYGTVHMSARPFLIPAVESESSAFQASMSHVADI